MTRPLNHEEAEAIAQRLNRAALRRHAADVQGIPPQWVESFEDSGFYVFQLFTQSDTPSAEPPSDRRLISRVRVNRLTGAGEVEITFQAD